MNSQDHSPLPWKVYYATNHSMQILGVGTADGKAITNDQGWLWGEDDEAKANAEFIVQSCNARNELVNALEKARKIIQDDRRSWIECHSKLRSSLKGGLEVVPNTLDKEASEILRNYDEVLATISSALEKVEIH